MYTAPSATKPWSGGSVKVKGSNTARAMVAVRPGIAPTNRPAETPAKMERMITGSSSIMNVS